MKKIVLNSTFSVISKSNASLDNPNINNVNFILTDDKPNANGVGIRREDFISFAQSAIFMPIKMSEGDIDDHGSSKPVGAIVQAEIDDDKIIGSGVVWPEERPADVALLKMKTEKGEAQISWEISYDGEVTDKNGTIWIKDPRLLAATLVKYPAYMGRTPMTGFSSTSEKSEEIMPESITEPVVEEVVEPVVEPIVEPIVEPTAEPIVEPTVEPVVEEEEIEEENEEVVALKKELEDLRKFKMYTERSKIVTELLGELPKKDLEVLVNLNDDELKVVKRLVSSKKEVAEFLPHIPGVEQADAISILKNALK